MNTELQLSVPDRLPPQDGGFDARPASVKAWIENLPMANIGQATRALYAALTEMNHQEMPAPQRFKSLELLRLPVSYVCEEMKRHFVGRPLPLPERTFRIACLARALTGELATGYKILVAEHAAGGRSRDRKRLVTSLHRALRLLGTVLLRSYQVYAAYPQQVWQEIHALYRYAEAQRRHNDRVLEEDDGGTRTGTIADLYKQILLLALACPYRLRHGEAEKIWQALEHWAPFAHLLPYGGADSDALFVTDLASDQPPTYLVLYEAGGDTGSRRTLDTSRLGDEVRHALTGLRHGGAAACPLSANTLRRLMLAWGVLPKRRFSRTRDHAQVIVAMGLSSIHYFVSGEVAFNSSSGNLDCPAELGSQRGNPFAVRPPGERDGAMPDLWEADFRLEGQAAPSTLEMAVAQASAGIHIDPSHRTQKWKMINVSAGGYCLLWDNPETTRAQVGELIGLREQSDPDTFHWRLGVIRWLKYVEKRGLELGVQMLSPGAVAVAARGDGQGGQNGYTRGLLLPEIASIQQQATLLLPSPPFRPDDTAIVNCHGKEIRVRLTKLVENTGSFAQFQFAPLGEVNKPDKRRTAAPPHDFDDIWEIL